MKDRQPRPLKKEDAEFLANVTAPLQTPEKPTQGIIFSGGFMFPRPELTSEQQKDLAEKIRNIRLHRS